jgi:hypothetical protein
MANNTIQWEGKNVAFAPIEDGVKFINARRRYSKFAGVCPICKIEFDENNTTSLWLVISNQVGIPNRYCHSECFVDKTFEYVFKIIYDDYQLAKFHMEWLQNSGWVSPTKVQNSGWVSPNG